MGNITRFEKVISPSGSVERTINAIGGVSEQRFSRDGSLVQVSGSSEKPRKMTYRVVPTAHDGKNINAQVTRVIFLDGNGGESEWSETWVDPPGRDIKTVFPRSNLINSARG